MRSFFTALFILSCLAGKTQVMDYSVSEIPEALLKNADVVVRSQEEFYEVISLDETVYRYKVAYTILNSDGERYASMSEYYDNSSKITTFEGSLYDAAGKFLKRVKSKEIKDYSAISDISLMEDNRIKIHDFHYRNYPFTVEYEVELKRKTTFYMPGWNPQLSENIAVEKSSYTLTVPDDYKVRYKAFNYKGDPEIQNIKGKKQYVWKVAKLPAIKRPFTGPLWHELTTRVFIAPSDFEMEGYRGNVSTWQNFGKFILELNKGRDQLPAEVEQKVKELTLGITDEKEKIRVLYEYLQKNTRYISIQLGIGGFQPFEANFVAKKGYGDCKALSNYMYSLLKAAGIRSHYTLVSAGNEMDRKFIMEEFPMNRFNHAILCVPLAKDTMWLECTSQTDAAGYMGSFTGNRKALLITEEGGKLVSTPRYGIKENLQIRKIKAVLSDNGSLHVSSSTQYSGIQQDQLQAMVVRLSKEEVKKRLQQNLQLATYHVNSFNYTEVKDMLPKLNEELDLTVNNYATITGKRLFITPNILSRDGMKLTEESRTVDFVFDYEYHDEEEVEIIIPEGYEVEAQPKDVSIKTKYGTYSISVKLVGKTIIYKRTREQFSGRFPSSEQENIINFFEEIYKADRARMVLVKKEEGVKAF